MSDSYPETHSPSSAPVPKLIGDLREHDQEPIREGLPPNFRMRADRHYVESLDRAPEPPPVDARTDPSLRAAADVLEATLRDLQHVLDLAPATSLTRHAVRALGRAHAARARCLHCLIRAVQFPGSASRRAVSLRDIVDRVGHNVETERPGLAMVFEGRLEDADVRVEVDPEVVVSAWSLCLSVAFDPEREHVLDRVGVQLDAGRDEATVRVSMRAPISPATRGVADDSRLEIARAAMETTSAWTTVRASDDALEVISALSSVERAHPR